MEDASDGRHRGGGGRQEVTCSYREEDSLSTEEEEGESQE